MKKPKQIHGFTIRPQIMQLIQDDVPGFTKDSLISEELLESYKLRYTENTVGNRELAQAIRNHEVISDDLLLCLADTKPTLIDKVANFASSYWFGLSLIALISTWVYVNHTGGFDEYPFNLLDLVLGVIASMQALFIMISQSKSASQDKLRTVNALKISLKNEFELSVIREKIDHIKDVQMPEIYKGVKKP